MSKSFDVQRATTQPVCSGMYFQTPEDLAAALRNVLCFQELAAELIAEEIFKLSVSAECTCPSGDGSLRWPCPVHPPEVKPVSLVPKWTACCDALPDENQMVAVFDHSGEGYLIAWRSCWKSLGEKNTGGWEWISRLAILTAQISLIGHRSPPPNHPPARIRAVKHEPVYIRCRLSRWPRADRERWHAGCRRPPGGSEFF